MKLFKPTLFLLALFSITACKNDKKTEEIIEVEEIEIKEETSYESGEMVINLNPKSDSEVTGTVAFNYKNNTVMMTANMTGLTEGTHAIHIHQTADCSSADGKSTGGHWNPTNQPHAKWGAETGYHKGDIGNFEVGADGIGRVEFKTDQWCIGCGDPNKDISGKAIIVHQGTDDFTSQPSGAAGKRVSCAGIIE